MVQIDPEPLYDHRLIEWVTTYLQTRDPNIFPFSRNFDADQQRAFVHDLRIGLGDLQDSGSARKTSASGFIVSDSLLKAIVTEWAAANGGWPASHDPSNPDGLVSMVIPDR